MSRFRAALRRLRGAALVATMIVPAGIVVLGVPEQASAASCTISTTVRYGSTGSAVRCVQSRLIELGYAPGPVDGIFGLKTASAVRRFQTARGLYVDGVVGPKTAGAMGIWGSAAVQNPACVPPASVPSSARQVLVVTASGSYADVDLLTSDGTTWSCSRMNMTGRVGRNGIRPLADRRSGDGTTPSGTFPLGSMTAPNGQTFQFFGNGTNPGVRGTWHQVASGDCWVATPNVAAYNTLVARSLTKCQAPDEYLPLFTGAYTRAALIGANMGPDRSGDEPGEPALAAAIFLHRFSYTSTGLSKATSGCVSLGLTNLTAVLKALVPGQAWFVIR